MEFKNPVFGLVIIKESRITEDPAVHRLHAWCWEPGSLCAPRTPRAGLQTDAWASTDVCSLFPHLAFVSSLWASIVGSFDVTAGALLKLNERTAFPNLRGGHLRPRALRWKGIQASQSDAQTQSWYLPYLCSTHSSCPAMCLYEWLTVHKTTLFPSPGGFWQADPKLHGHFRIRQT